MARFSSVRPVEFLGHGGKVLAFTAHFPHIPLAASPRKPGGAVIHTRGAFPERSGPVPDHLASPAEAQPDHTGRNNRLWRCPISRCVSFWKLASTSATTRGA